VTHPCIKKVDVRKYLNQRIVLTMDDGIDIAVLRAAVPLHQLVPLIQECPFVRVIGLVSSLFSACFTNGSHNHVKYI